MKSSNTHIFEKTAINDQRTKALEEELFEAIKKDQFDTVNNLLNAGVNINAKNEEGYTFLLMAALYDNSRLVTFFLENGALMQGIEEHNIFKPYHITQFWSPEIVELLLNAGAPIPEDWYNHCHRDVFDATLAKIWEAARAGNTKALMAFGPNIHCVSSEKGSALTIAASWEHVETVKALLDANVDTEAASYRGGTALCHAARSGNQEIVEMLLANKANIEAQVPDKCCQFTSLFMAIHEGHTNIVETLLNEGAKTTFEYKNEPDRISESALNHAVSAGNPAIVQLLVDAGADVTKCKPFYISCGGKDPSIRSILEAALRKQQAMASKPSEQGAKVIKANSQKAPNPSSFFNDISSKKPSEVVPADPKEEITRLRAQVATLERSNQTLAADNKTLIAQVVTLERSNQILEAEKKALTAQIESDKADKEATEEKMDYDLLSQWSRC